MSENPLPECDKCTFKTVCSMTKHNLINSHYLPFIREKIAEKLDAFCPIQHLIVTVLTERYLKILDDLFLGYVADLGSAKVE